MTSAVFDHLIKTIFALEDPFGAAVNQIIVGLFILGIADVLYAGARLGWEWLGIRRARRVLDGTAECPIEPPKSALEFLGISKRSALGQRLVQTLRRRAAGLSPGEEVAWLSAERLAGFGSIARFIAGVLPLLGLLGTVYGLSLAVANTQLVISTEFSLEAARDLAVALGDTLGGMKTAFATTLAGLLAALPLAFLNHGTRRWHAYVEKDLESFVAEGFLPSLEVVDPDGDAAARVFAETLKSSAATLGAVSETVAKAAEIYQAASTELGQTVGRMVDAATATATTFEAGLGRLGDQQRDLTQAIRDTTDTVRSLGASVRQQYETLEEVTRSSSQVLTTRLDKMEQHSATVEQAQGRLETLADAVHHTVQTLDTRSEALLQMLKQELESTLPGLGSEIGQRQQQALESWQGSAHERLETLLAGHRDHLAEIRDAHRSETSAVLDGHLQALGTLSASLAETLERQSSQLDTLLARHGEGLDKLAEINRSQLTSMLGDHHTAFQAVSDMVLDMNHHVGTLLEQLMLGSNHHAPEALDRELS